MRRQTTIVPWKRAASKWPKPWKRACARGKWQDQVGKRAWELRLAKACGNGLCFPHIVLPTYTASAYLLFCNYCKLKHQCFAQALQKGNTLPWQMAQTLLYSMQAKWKRKKWEHASSSSIREAEGMCPLGTCLLEHFANGMSASC